MTDIPRRQIEEMIALHEKEPDLREVFVEGLSDKQLVEWFLAENGLALIPVFEVSTVEVPAELVLKAGLEDGNRGRVIALAEALAAEGPARGTVTCIADSDFDFVLGVDRQCPVLLTTDFTSMHLYAFNERTTEKILKLVLKGFGKSAAVVLKEIAGPLQELFLLRVASYIEKLGLDFSKPNASGFYKSFKLTESGFEFDSDRYLRSLLQAHGAMSKRELMLKRISELRPKLKEDPRYQIQGHDFEQALALYLRRHKGFGGLRSDVISGSIVSALETDLLRQHRLFQHLMRRCSATPEQS